MINDLWVFERDVRNENNNLICGVDEAGRGPLAGPVFAAAVILPFELNIDGLNDSKKLSAAKRESLFEIITRSAVAYSIASASENEIDELNILNATFLAMSRAISGLSPKADFALIDGNMVRSIDIPAKSIVKGDGLSASIAAASILAKVSRDRYMTELSRSFPDYMFEKHKGYPTKQHYECIEKHGVSRVHRRSFLKKYIKEGDGL